MRPTQTFAPAQAVSPVFCGRMVLLPTGRIETCAPKRTRRVPPAAPSRAMQRHLWASVQAAMSAAQERQPARSPRACATTHSGSVLRGRRIAAAMTTQGYDDLILDHIKN